EIEAGAPSRPCWCCGRRRRRPRAAPAAAFVCAGPGGRGGAVRMELTEGERGAAAAPGRRGRGRHVAAGAAAAPGRRGRARGRVRAGQSPAGTG
ncbi:hypothetical protein Nmel_018654, partial [Mimus melanotis]